MPPEPAKVSKDFVDSPEVGLGKARRVRLDKGSVELKSVE